MNHGLNCWDGNWEHDGLHADKKKPFWQPILDELLRHIPGARNRARVRHQGSALPSLPLTLEMYRFLTDSNHYHVGYFKNPDDTLHEALDQIVKRCVPYFVPQGRMLDLGCGIGGATTLLADSAFPCLGVDPNSEHIRFAGQTLRPRKNMAFAVLGLQDLLSCRKSVTAHFDNIMVTEILQFFPDAGFFFKGCHRLLRTGGVMIINDFATIPSLKWEYVPFHRQGAICAAAEAVGLLVEREEDITAEVIPTFDHLIDRITTGRDSLVEKFGAGHPDISEIISDQIQIWEELRLGIRNGDLVYETTVCRLPGKHAEHA